MQKGLIGFLKNPSLLTAANPDFFYIQPTE